MAILSAPLGGTTICDAGTVANRQRDNRGSPFASSRAWPTPRGMQKIPFRSRDTYRHWQPIVTRWSDNDMYGHVNNSIYYHWFDTAVNNWLMAAGCLDPGGGEVIGLVVETGCRYSRPLAYPQPVEIGLAVDHVGRSSVVYTLGAFAQGEREAAAEARFVHVYVDHATRRPCPIPAAWRGALSSIRLTDGDETA